MGRDLANRRSDAVTSAHQRHRAIVVARRGDNQADRQSITVVWRDGDDVCLSVDGPYEASARYNARQTDELIEALDAARRGRS